MPSNKIKISAPAKTLDKSDSKHPDNPLCCGGTWNQKERNEIDILQFFNEWFRVTMIAVVFI